MAPKKKKKKDKKDGSGAADDPAIVAMLQGQKMAVEKNHLNTRVSALLVDQEAVASEKDSLAEHMRTENSRHGHIGRHLNEHIREKDAEIDRLKRQLTASSEQHAARVAEVQGQLAAQQQKSQERLAGLNKRIEALGFKSSQLEEYDNLAAHKGELVSQLKEARAALRRVRGELDTWQRQTVVLMQPLHTDSVVVLLLEAMRLYPALESIQVEALAALQNVVTGEDATGIKENCKLIRQFGGVAIVLGVMRRHLTHERVQCHACSLLWKLSFWDPENIPVITANGGLHLILAAMTAHPTVAKFQYAATGVLREVVDLPAANKDGTRSPSPFMRAPVIESPTPKPISPNSRFPLIEQVKAARAESQAELEPPGPMPAPGSVPEEEMEAAWSRMHVHAMQLLLKCMSDHLSQAYIQISAIGSLLNILSSSDAAVAAAGRGGVVAAVVAAMDRHEDNEELVEVGLRTVTRLATARQNKKLLIKAGAPELVQRIVQIHLESPEVQAAGNGALVILSLDVMESHNV